MLALTTIEQAVRKIAVQYPIKSVALFGSYATGQANAKSDVDVIVEFSERPITLLDYCGFQQELSEQLNVAVDIVEFPLNEETRRIVRKAVPLYEKQG